jgi:hypothetical protein
MKRFFRTRFEMFQRVVDFGKEQLALFAESSIGGQSFAVVAAAVDAIETHLANRLVARAEAQKLKASTKAAVYNALKTIALTARQVTAADPGANPFRLPRHKAVSNLIVAGRVFVAEAAKRQEAFVSRNLPPTFVADLGRLVDDLERAAEAQNNARTGRHEAQAGIAAAIESGMRAVRELDVIVPNALALDPARLGGWYGARRIEGVGAGSKRAADGQPAAGVPTAPAPPAGDAVLGVAQPRPTQPGAATPGGEQKAS